MGSVKSRIKKAAGHIGIVLKGVLFIGISIQTVMGIVWMCCNFPHVPQFGESLFYIRLSRTLRCDEYTGILYPLFLWAVRRNHYVVYVLQLAAAYASARYFLGVFRPGSKAGRIWGSLALMTAPVVMQCHMAMLPCSFAASLMLWELALLAGAIKAEDKRTLSRLAGLCFCWLASALLLPEYLYLGAVPVALYGICCHRRWRDSRRERYYGLLLIAVFIGMCGGINSLSQTRGLYGRPQKTPLMVMTQRIAWTNMLKDYDSWPQEILSCVGENVVWESAWYADGMDNFFFPAMERAVADQVITKQQESEYYRAMIRLAWGWHKTTILKEIAWDMLGYGASPGVLQVFLKGRDYDFGSRNYDFFLEYTPKLSKVYMDYGSWWFVAAALLAAVLQVLRTWGNKAEKRKAALVAACCLATVGTMILWYTMRGAGMFDYKNTIITVQLWMAWERGIQSEGPKADRE